MTMATLAILVGLVLLVWSADKFVEGAAATAKHMGMPSLLIGIVIIGFGTSAPEMVVSALAASDGNPGLALGNAYGSNITNIALILGVTALIAPIAVQSQIIRKELPILLAVTLLAGWLIHDGHLGGVDAAILLVVLLGLMGWSIKEGLSQRQDILASEVDDELDSHPMSLKLAVIWLVIGLLFLVLSSRMLVWGAVTVAQSLGVSDLIIGLTIVAIGTSLPELASSIMAAKKGEHDLAIGNVIGSNLFNTLAVVGIAAGINPLTVESEVLTRDWALMLALTIGLLVMAIGIKGPGRITRLEGAVLLGIYFSYTGYLGYGIISH